MSKTLVRKGISFVQNSCLVAGSLSESTSEPGRRHERVRASNARARPPRPGRKKQRTHPSQQSLKAVLSRDERKPAVSNEKPVLQTNLKSYQFKQKRSRKMIEKISQYAAEAKGGSAHARETPGPLGVHLKPPKRGQGGRNSKAEKKRLKKRQFSVLNIPNMGTVGF